MNDADTLLAALDPAPPEAAPEPTPEPPKVEEKKPEAKDEPDRVSKSLLALQRRESEIRRQEREVKAREDAVKLDAQRVDAAAAVLRDAAAGKIDAAEAIDRIAKATGVQISTRQLVEAVAKKGRVVAAPAVDTEALAELRKSIDEVRGQLSQREKQEVRSGHEGRIAEAMKDSTRYEAVAAAGWSPAHVFDAMERHYQATGEVLDIPDALDRLETQELERAKRLGGLKKLTGGAPVGTRQDPQATPAELTSGDGAVATKPPATISQQLSGPGTRTVEGPEPRWNDHEGWLKRAGLAGD